MTFRAFAYATLLIGIAAIVFGYTSPVQEGLSAIWLGITSLLTGILLLAFGRAWGPDRAPTRERWGRGPAH